MEAQHTDVVVAHAVQQHRVHVVQPEIQCQTGCVCKYVALAIKLTETPALE